MAIHGTPVSLGRAMQVHAVHSSGLVLIRGTGDTLTMTGMIKMAAALGSYYAGLPAGTNLSGWTPAVGTGGVGPLPACCRVESAFVAAHCRVGDEADLATQLEAVLTTPGNTTVTPEAVTAVPTGTEASELTDRP